MSNEETNGGRWQDRIQWSRSGYQAEDHHVNEVLSRWLAGEGDPFELAVEIHAAYGEHLKNELSQPNPGAGDFDETVKSVRLGAEWLRVIGAFDFCLRHPEWNTPERRQEALAAIDQGLGAGASPGDSWINEIRRTPVGIPALDERLTRTEDRWASGSLTHREYFEELVDIQRGTVEHRDAVQADPQADQLAAWTSAIRAGVRGMTLRAAADYCETEGWTDAERRRTALQRLDEALERSPDRESGRGR